MAPESRFDDTPTFRRTFGKFQEFSFVDDDNAKDINLGLETVVSCANLLFEARAEGAIEFKPGVTARMLEMMGILLTRAAHAKEDKRKAMFQLWSERGPQVITELLERVRDREGKLLAPDDLTMFMGCPDGFEI